MKCQITGKKKLSGNMVSHSNRKTKRFYKPNVHKFSFMSYVLGVKVSMNVCVSTVRSIDRSGGIDQFLLSTPDRKLSGDVLGLKKRIFKKSNSSS